MNRKKADDKSYFDVLRINGEDRINPKDSGVYSGSTFSYDGPQAIRYKPYL